MANQLEGNNTQQKLIGGAARQPQRQPQAEDVFVANVGEKRYLWTARAFAIITAISLCCNIVLLLAIAQVLPLYRVEPFLLTFQNKEEQVYNIQPIRGRMEDQKAITEVFVRQYVLLRSSFDRDIQEMEARWMPGGPVQEMSSSAVYTEFLEKTAQKALDLIRARSLQRNLAGDCGRSNMKHRICTRILRRRKLTIGRLHCVSFTIAKASNMASVLKIRSGLR